ncbi:DoxX family protein [Pseudonocardia kunmingensis]|uniref:DoxX-like protein n=1 Tax=Pseudonocardia kunmingensis TaxID=630975 RepID=A0A543DKX0_9PSEU|nr:DoxX family protein [Pseudonocardia kunmingensis]TQM09986.1 DoxX-like protein [Pseudonocardia kunmingensis]
MFVLYVSITLITALAAGAGTWMNYTRHPTPVAAAKQVQVPESWMVPLGTLQGLGALGLIAGFVFPPIGLAAATGLVLYFIGAVIAHLRVGDRHYGAVLPALALVVTTLVVTVAYRLG